MSAGRRPGHPAQPGADCSAVGRDGQGATVGPRSTTNVGEVESTRHPRRGVGAGPGEGRLQGAGPVGWQRVPAGRGRLVAGALPENASPVPRSLEMGSRCPAGGQGRPLPGLITASALLGELPEVGPRVGGLPSGSRQPTEPLELDVWSVLGAMPSPSPQTLTVATKLAHQTPQGPRTHDVVLGPCGR